MPIRSHLAERLKAEQGYSFMDEQINQIIRDNQRFLIIQADNPDGDSLGSSLALESILTDMGKTVYLYCGVDMPNYLRFKQHYDATRILLSAN